MVWCGSEALRKYGGSEGDGDGDDVVEKCDRQWTALRLYERAPQKESITRVAKEAKLESSQSFVMNYHGGFFGSRGSCRHRWLDCAGPAASLSSGPMR